MSAPPLQDTGAECWLRPPNVQVGRENAFRGHRNAFRGHKSPFRGQ